MDVLAVTDFPDIRLKSAISSAHGNILIIPREGGYLTRFYVELDKVDLDKRSVTPERLTEVANRILHPYSVEVKRRRLVVGLRDRAAAVRQVRRRARRRRYPRASRACSSRATPATPTAPRRARA